MDRTWILVPIFALAIFRGFQLLYRVGLEEKRGEAAAEASERQQALEALSLPLPMAVGEGAVLVELYPGHTFTFAHEVSSELAAMEPQARYRHLGAAVMTTYCPLPQVRSLLSQAELIMAFTGPDGKQVEAFPLREAACR